MTGFKPQTSDVGSDCSTTWATTTAQLLHIFTLYFWSGVLKVLLGSGGGLVGIAVPSATRDPWFESSQGPIYLLSTVLKSQT